MVHTLRLDNYSPTPRKLVLGTNSSFGTESIKIERGAGWDGLNLTATWHIPGREEPLRVALLDGDAMDVPPEVTKEAKDGVLVLAGLASGVQRASCNVEYLILEQAGVYGGADAEPTPELAAQVLEAALQAKADAKVAAEDAAAAKANADKAQADAEKAQQAAENAAADAAKAGPYAEAARAAQEAAEAARDEAIAAQRAAENAAKSAQDAQAAAEKARDEAKAAQKGAEAARDTAAKSAEAAAKSEANAKQSADTLAESVENVVANTAAVAELKEKKAEIDDTAVGANAWSSKHIIDMLCPPLEESGNPVVCYPVAGYPLGVTAKWEPVQEGSGTPSPENIRPIKGRDSVTVERCGENLIDSGRVIEVSAAYGLTAQYVSGKITISGIYHNSSANASFSFMSLSYKLPPTTKFVHLGLKTSGCTLKEIRFTDRAYNNLAIDLDGLTNGEKAEISFYLIAYVGTTAPTTYTPYIGQTNTLALPETVYGGEVDAVTGSGRCTWNKVSLDGTESWIEPSSNAYYAAFGYIPSDGSEHGVASHYPYGVRAKNLFANQNGAIVLYGMNDSLSINEWKSFLAAQYAAGTPVQVCYKLAEPVPFTATGAQPMPALAGVNTVLTDADSATVTGRADPIKRIEDLEAAVASIN